MTRGEIWWAELEQPIGRRPILILTRAAAVSARNQVVVAQITRTAHKLASEVPLTSADGMPKACVVNCDVLVTVSKKQFRNRITTLSSAKMAAVEQALKFALELT
ncbi:MAG: type II toxin-antitoxin system PemK/MazF family toxin [Planctomycetaceae bacterium]